MSQQTTPTFEMIATTQFGLEELLANELRNLGASDLEPLNRAVKFSGDHALLYRANLCLRTAVKVLVPFMSFQAKNDRQFYNRLRDVDWSHFLTPRKTLAVDAVTNSEFFHHSKFVALRTKDAIVDQFRDRFGIRPSVELDDPDLRINVHVFGDQVSLSLDSSGTTLDRRGYRLNRTEAPMNEVLAAGIVMLSEWDGTTPLVDPMCGSGTLGIEAAMFAANIAPGKKRNFGFEKWPDFDAERWQKIKEEAQQAERRFSGKIYCSDLDGIAIEVSEQNAKRAGVSRYMDFRQRDFFETKAPSEAGTLLLNPPYGERLVEDEIVEYYKEIGNQFKHQFPGFTAWVISANLEALKHLGLKPAKKIILFNGPLECRLNKYELFEGSKKFEDKVEK